MIPLVRLTSTLASAFIILYTQYYITQWISCYYLTPLLCCPIAHLLFGILIGHDFVTSTATAQQHTQAQKAHIETDTQQLLLYIYLRNNNNNVMAIHITVIDL